MDGEVRRGMLVAKGKRAGTKNLRETNVELREENPKTSQEALINFFCGAP